jgi:signal transduction histidine kinase
MPDQSSLLSVNNLTKYYGNLPALAGVNISLDPGEVLGVVGQRGSGKSTLFKLLSGVEIPSQGEIYYQGSPLLLKNPSHAQMMGIETVHQLPEIAENLSVLENVFLGREISGPWTIQFLPDIGEMLEEARNLFTALGVPAELLYKRAANLSDEQKQIVALGRAMIRPGRLLLLDDPLPALSYERQLKLLTCIRDYSSQNVAVVISSDDLNHIFAITDHILVLFKGTPVKFCPTAETTPREIVELIVGSNRQAQVTPVIWAFENYHIAQQQAEDLRRSQETLRQNLEAQDSLNRQLIEKLHEQVEAADRLARALQEANRRLITEREAERKALARDLHDQVIQDLLSFNYQLEELENETATDPQREEMEKIRDGIRQVVGSLRNLCSNLRPPTIDSHGLSAAIRSFSHQWSEQTGVDVSLKIDPALGRLPEMIELSVFRILQEGLNNVRKHANATQVKLSLRRTPTASLVVQLSDNGQGIDRPINLAALSKEKHFGLVGISERVSLLSGTMKVNTQSHGGLELFIEIPSPYPSINN